MDMEFNLFNWAKKELSQDAFLAWTFSNFNNKSDEKLRNFSKAFIENIFGLTLDDTDHMTVKTQVSRIDLLLEITDEKGSLKNLIIIEDKVDTQEHDNQLTKYMEGIIENKKYYSNGVFDNEKLSVFYYKTGHLYENPNFSELLHENKCYVSEKERISTIKAESKKNGAIEVNVKTILLNEIAEKLIKLKNEQKIDNIIVNQYIDYLAQRKNDFESEDFLKLKDAPADSVWAKVMDGLVSKIKKEFGLPQEDLDIVSGSYSGKHCSIQVIRKNYPWLEINSKIFCEKRFQIFSLKNNKVVKEEYKENRKKLYKKYAEKYSTEFKKNPKGNEESQNQLFSIKCDVNKIENCDSFKAVVTEVIKEYIDFTK